MPDNTHLNPSTCQWWNLNRRGEPIPIDHLPPRTKDSPPMKDSSPYTPTFYADAEEKTLPETHLHWDPETRQITGIHGEADLVLLRLILGLLIHAEKEVIGSLMGQGLHHKDIPISLVWNCIKQSAADDGVDLY